MSVVKQKDIEEIKYDLHLKSDYVPMNPSIYQKKESTKLRLKKDSIYRIDGIEVSKSTFDLHVQVLRKKGIKI